MVNNCFTIPNNATIMHAYHQQQLAVVKRLIANLLAQKREIYSRIDKWGLRG